MIIARFAKMVNRTDSVGLFPCATAVSAVRRVAPTQGPGAGVSAVRGWLR